jgi:Flp pilus assembly protein TadB
MRYTLAEGIKKQMALSNNNCTLLTTIIRRYLKTICKCERRRSLSPTYVYVWMQCFCARVLHACICMLYLSLALSLYLAVYVCVCVCERERERERERASVQLAECCKHAEGRRNIWLSYRRKLVDTRCRYLQPMQYCMYHCRFRGG